MISLFWLQLMYLLLYYTFNNLLVTRRYHFKLYRGIFSDTKSGSHNILAVEIMAYVFKITLMFSSNDIVSNKLMVKILQNYLYIDKFEFDDN